MQQISLKEKERKQKVTERNRTKEKWKETNKQKEEK